MKKIVSLLLIAICSLTLSLGCSGDKKGTGTSGTTSGSPSGSGSKTTP